MRLPRTLVFPFGFIIKLKCVTAAEMKSAQADDCDGYWDVGTRTIYLRRRLPAKRLRYILLHEMQHALTDYIHEMLDDGVAKN